MSNGPGATPLRVLSDGAAAGLMATVAMDAVRYAKERRSGSDQSFADFELARGVDSWEAAPAPGQVGRRLIEGLRQKPLPASAARPVTTGVHLATGALRGAAFGLVASSLHRGRFPWALAFGPLVWAANYSALTAVGMYKPTEQEPSSVASDVGVHLVYGIGGAVAYYLVDRMSGSNGKDR
ncbi:MAG: hypothetical protein ACRDJU_00245 [Actinomycetota bacterium]